MVDKQMTEENELIRAAEKMAVEAGKMGVTLEEAARNLKILIENIPPLSAYDLELINQNPSLSTIDKLILKRKIKKYIKGVITMRRIDADELKKAFYMDDSNYSQPAIFALIDKAPTVPAEARVVGHMNFSAEDVLELLHKKYAFPGEWIPVEEALPAKTGKYLVTVLNGNVYAGTFSTYDNRFNCKATAWMPLPEPYKEND